MIAILTSAASLAEKPTREEEKWDRAKICIKCIMGAMHVPYRLGLAEGKATEQENYMETYDPKTFVAAVNALFEGRTIEFTD